MQALRQEGVDVQPIELEGRKITKTFWGEAWCDHLESFSDFENRLPRGRRYVRNGSVCHLAIEKGVVKAKVAGSDVYGVEVCIETLPARKWKAVKRECTGQIGSLLELLRGNLSDNIMQVVTDRQNGLFPLPDEISLECDCPDWAVMCKHVAAVLYGVGARLDEDPALLFQLRGVNHDELIDVDARAAVPSRTRRGGAKRLASDDLGDVFGIEFAADAPKTSSKDVAKKKRKAKKASAAKRASSAKKAKPAKKTPAKRSTKKQTGKAAVAKKKATKKANKKATKKTTKKKTTAKKTTAKKTTKKKTAKKKTAR